MAGKSIVGLAELTGRLTIAGKRAVVTILAVLTAGNAIWSVSSEHAATWIAVAAYAVVTITVLRGNDYRAGFIVGLAGFVIHVVELAARGAAHLGQIERAWLAANIVLPILLVWFSYVLIRRARRSGATTLEDGPERPHD